jgi:hypothetical protein
MIVFHGSDVAIAEPEIRLSARFLDFGIGFYTTTNLGQAQRWASRVARIRQTRRQFISRYEVDEEILTQLRVIRFHEPDASWLDFVTANRLGKPVPENFDVVSGPVADDSVYATVQLYESGLLSLDETLVRLKVENLADQVLFHTVAALEALIFLAAEEVSQP